MGSIFAPKVPSPPPPPPEPELVDFVSEVQNIERVTVEGPDGRKRVVERALPLSEEEQAAVDQLQSIAQENLTRIEELSASELAIDIPEFQQAINAYRTTGEQQLEESFARAAQAQEETLARRGIADSTAATESRAQRSQQRVEAEQALGRETTLFGEQLRQQAIGRAQNLFGIATNRQDVGQAQLAQALQGGTAIQGSLLGAQQQRQNQIFQAGLAQQQAQIQAQQSGFSNIGGLLGLGVLGASVFKPEGGYNFFS